MAKFLKGWGDTEGPLGLPMKSADAKALDEILKGLPKECREIGLRRVAKLPANMKLDEGERADISFVTAETMDADRELVLASGLDWDRFKKAGMPVTWCHNYSQLPVGRAAWVKRSKDGDKDGWLAKTIYASAPANWKGDWFGDAVWSMVQSKIIRGKSIGFVPTKMRAPTTKEAETNEGLRWVFESVIILEYAVCPIQSNPDAVVEEVSKAIKKGANVPQIILEDLGIILPEDTPGIDPAFLEKTVPNPATDPSPENPPPEVLPKVVPHLTAAEYCKAVVSGLKKELEKVDLGEMIRDEIDRRRGRI